MPSPQHAKDYLQRADSIPHRREGEATLLEFLPAQLGRFLDLGAGGGRLLRFVKSARPASVAWLWIFHRPCSRCCGIPSEENPGLPSSSTISIAPFRSWVGSMPWLPALRSTMCPTRAKVPCTPKSLPY